MTDPNADELRDQLLCAIDAAYANGVLGYSTPEELLAAYDTSRTPSAVRPWAETIDSTSTVRIPWLTPDGAEGGAVRVDHGQAGLLARMLLDLAGQPTVDRDALRQRIAQALTAAVYKCDGKCGLTEQQCYDAHPVTFSAMTGGTTHVDGPVTAIADVALAAVLPASDADAYERTEPTPLRWGLDDVEYGDDGTTTILLSGPAGEPYWLELEPERAAALRDSLAGPDGAKPAVDRAALRQRIAEALMRWAEDNNSPLYASMRRPETVVQNAYSRADAVLAVLPGPITQANEHVYLSTSCLHGDTVLPDGRTGHQYCQSETGKTGAKTPAQCKVCAAPCICPCHQTTGAQP